MFRKERREIIDISVYYYPQILGIIVQGNFLRCVFIHRDSMLRKKKKLFMKKADTEI